MKEYPLVLYRYNITFEFKFHPEKVRGIIYMKEFPFNAAVNCSTGCFLT